MFSALVAGWTPMASMGPSFFKDGNLTASLLNQVHDARFNGAILFQGWKYPKRAD